MRVLLDTNGLHTTRAGVARYIRGLIRGLQQKAPLAQLDTLAWPVDNFEFHQPQRAIKTAYRELVWYPWIAPHLVRKRHPDLVHYASCSCVIPRSGVPEVITLHDLALLRHPERYRRWQRWSGLRRYSNLTRARFVICISQFTAQEASALLGLSPDKIRVVYSGCDYLEPGFSPGPASATPAIPDEFFLFVGSLEPGKNLSLLRAAYDLAAQAQHRLPPLVIVGARWQGVGHEGPVEHDWRYLGHQPDAVLVELYRRSLALVFPSKYEGFGLPVIEAMSQGCPVICSRVASLPEAGGDAALFADMTPEAYLHAMRQLQQDNSLRQQLVQRGLRHCQPFTWARCAEKTIDVYREALHHP
jgi:glycosyltransferase involved in cell wall biosynthesis